MNMRLKDPVEHRSVLARRFERFPKTPYLFGTDEDMRDRTRFMLAIAFGVGVM